MISGYSIARRAELLADQKRIREAVDLLRTGANANDADACHMLAHWLLAGQRVRRDLGMACRLFGRAGQLGRRDSAAIHIAMLGNGAGGERNWREALTRLRRLGGADPAARAQAGLVDAMALTDEGDPAVRPEGRRLSERPSITLFPAFLSAAECAYLIAAAMPLLEPSTVVHPATGQLVRNPIRTSDAAFFPLALENPAVHAINRRIGAASGVPPTHGEPLHVLRYAPGQQYRLHSDALPQADNQRTMTMLVYLNGDFRGGETRFPFVDLAIRPKAGDAVLFRNVLPGGGVDEAARHAGDPVVAGTKFVASRWIRAAPLDLSGGRSS